MRKIYFFYFLLLLPFALNAQEVPVDNKFKGEWLLDYVVVYENQQGGSEEFTKWKVSAEEFSQYEYLRDMPIVISFYEVYHGLIAGTYYQYSVQPLMNEKGELVFRERIERNDMPYDEESLRMVGPVLNNLQFSGSSISVDYNFTYRNAQNQEIQGYAQIFYKSK